MNTLSDYNPLKHPKFLPALKHAIKISPEVLREF